MAAYLFDVESTGLVEPQIVEWALAEVSPLWKLGRVESGRCCPTKDIELGAFATHHILPDELAGEPSSEHFRLPADTEYIIGWNIDYDWQAAGSPEGIKRIDLEKIARRMLPGFDCYSQSAVFYGLFGINAESRARLLAPGGKRASQDVENLWRILDQLAAMGSDKGHFVDVESLWFYSEECRVPETMMFGKHKGQHIREVPTGYRNWYAGQADADPWILKAFDKYPRH